jgi:5-methylcytosine-specific restriction protein A
MSKHADLYNNSAWRARRAEQLRAHPLCRFCFEHRGVVTPATVADHVTPHKGNAELFAGPLQSLCATCHSGSKRELETTGTFRGCDLRGVPLDPNHPWRRDLEAKNNPGGGG